MELKERLLIISQIGFECFQSKSYDGYWLIGMLSDLTLPDDKLNEHIEEIKIKLPEYAHFFENVNRLSI